MSTHYAPVCFFVHAAELFNHYISTWRLLGSDAFDIVLHGSDQERLETLTLATEAGYRCIESETVINTGHRYDIVVANHSMFDHFDQPILHVLGHRRVRFMYALGKARHNFAEWNSHFDMILCFGPWQAERMRQCCQAVTFQMGYPRYDAYFRHPELIGQPAPGLEHLLDPARKTVLWLPTWLELSSVTRYADVMATLCSTYNVIVKLHPLSSDAEPHVISELAQYRFTAVITTVYDNLALFRCADFVIGDYGGTPFGALYLDKPLVLLNVPAAADDPLMGDDSPDILLRKDIANVDEHRRWELPSMLADTALWEAQATVRQRLRQKYFVNSYGFSAEMAVMALCNIETLLKQG